MHTKSIFITVLLNFRSHKEESSESGRTSPPSQHHGRDSSAPVREIQKTSPPKSTPSVEEKSNEMLSKLERNLRRFDEERRRFEMEKRKFDEEKREADRVRQRRLEDFERKRAIQKKEELRQQEDVHQKLYSILRVIEDSKHHLPSILKLDKQSASYNTTSTEEEPTIPPIPPPRYIMPKRDESLEFPEHLPSESPDICEDYESSTALSSSSREGDFDDDDLTIIEKQPIVDIVKPIITASKVTKLPLEPVEVVPVFAKQSFLAKLLGRKPKPLPPPKVIIPPEMPSTGPVTLRRFFFVETRLVWHKLLADHPAEWKATMHMRNKCIADLIILTIFCGLGGMTFRFVEGAFENFYKCGVRRVKRDFVDNLWHTSHNLRLSFLHKYIRLNIKKQFLFIFCLVVVGTRFREDDWKTAARSKLRKFEEELHAAHEAGMTSYSGMKAWTFINGMIYCMTVVTTIGKEDLHVIKLILFVPV